MKTQAPRTRVPSNTNEIRGVISSTELPNVESGCTSISKQIPTVDEIAKFLADSLKTFLSGSQELQPLIAASLRNVCLKKTSLERLGLIKENFSKCVQAVCNGFMHGGKTPEAEKIQVVGIIVKYLFIPHYHLELAIGIGGSRDAARARAPSYVIAPAVAAEGIMAVCNEFAALGVTPPTRPIINVVAGHGAAIVCNNFEKEVVEPNMEENIRFLDAFIRTYHPQVLPCLRFSKISDAQIRSILRHAPNMATELDSKLISKLENMGTTHGGMKGKESSVAYGILHPFIFGDLQISEIDTKKTSYYLDLSGDSIRLYDDPLQSNFQQSGIISFGGSPESYFNQVRKSVAESLGSREGALLRDSAKLISKAGNTAVYFQGKHSETKKPLEEDLSAKDLAEKGLYPKKLPSSVKTDVSLLRNDLAMYIAGQLGMPPDTSSGKDSFKAYVAKHITETHPESIVTDGKPEWFQQLVQNLCKETKLNSKNTTNLINETASKSFVDFVKGFAEH